MAERHVDGLVDTFSEESNLLNRTLRRVAFGGLMGGVFGMYYSNMTNFNAQQGQYAGMRLAN